MRSTNPKDLIGQKKPPISLIPPAALIHEARAMGDGAAKYGPYNWREKKVSTRIYLDACLRHLLAYSDGERTATDSGVHHLAHARACLGILLDAEECGALIDDRGPEGGAANLIAKFTQTKDVPKDGCPSCNRTGMERLDCQQPDCAMQGRPIEARADDGRRSE